MNRQQEALQGVQNYVSMYRWFAYCSLLTSVILLIGGILLGMSDNAYSMFGWTVMVLVAVINAVWTLSELFIASHLQPFWDVLQQPAACFATSPMPAFGYPHVM